MNPTTKQLKGQAIEMTCFESELLKSLASFNRNQLEQTQTIKQLSKQMKSNHQTMSNIVQMLSTIEDTLYNAFNAREGDDDDHWNIRESIQKIACQ